MNARGVEELVADKGYHSGAVLMELHGESVRSYIPGPERGRRKWQGLETEQQRVYANRRRVIGWALNRTIEDDLALAALRMALAQRTVLAGLVHHSDRGSQYVSGDYTDLLKENGIDISMSRKGNPWDNAACESFMKTLKYEEVLRNEYRDLADARAFIGKFLEQVYNEQRLHSALGYRPPVEFELIEKEAATRQLSL